MTSIINNIGSRFANMGDAIVYTAGAGLLALKINAKFWANAPTLNLLHGKIDLISPEGMRKDGNNWHDCINRAGSAAKRIFSGKPNPRPFLQNCLVVRNAFVNRDNTINKTRRPLDDIKKDIRKGGGYIDRNPPKTSYKAPDYNEKKDSKNTYYILLDNSVKIPFNKSSYEKQGFDPGPKYLEVNKEKGTAQVVTCLKNRNGYLHAVASPSNPRTKIHDLDQKTQDSLRLLIDIIVHQDRASGPPSLEMDSDIPTILPEESKG